MYLYYKKGSNLQNSFEKSHKFLLKKINTLYVLDNVILKTSP